MPHRLAAASALSRREVHIPTTSTPGTERHPGRCAKAPQLALMIPTFSVPMKRSTATASHREYESMRAECVSRGDAELTQRPSLRFVRNRVGGLHSRALIFVDFSRNSY